MANRRLSQVERRGQLAHAHLAALMRPDQGNQPEPDRVAQGLEHLRQRGGRPFADRLPDQGSGAWLDDYPQLSTGHGLQSGMASVHRHTSILTVIYPAWQASTSCIDAYQ